MNGIIYDNRRKDNCCWDARENRVSVGNDASKGENCQQTIEIRSEDKTGTAIHSDWHWWSQKKGEAQSERGHSNRQRSRPAARDWDV
jgi:hypothetical protein